MTRMIWGTHFLEKPSYTCNKLNSRIQRRFHLPLNSHLFRQMFPISIFSQPQWAVDHLRWWIKCDQMLLKAANYLAAPCDWFLSQSVQVLTALAIGFHPFLLWGPPPLGGGGGGEKTEIFHFRGGGLPPPQHLEIFHLPKVKYFS